MYNELVNITTARRWWWQGLCKDIFREIALQCLLAVRIALGYLYGAPYKLHWQNFVCIVTSATS